MFEKLADPTQVELRQGHVPIRHRYTPGIAGEAFFRALKDRGEFVAAHCESCAITYCPPRLFCERCFDELTADRTVGPGGVLESFSVGYVGVEGEPLDEPVAVGLVRLDGADTVLVHFLVDWGDRALAIGERVEAALQPKSKRTGTMLDLRGFRPARR